MKRTVVLVGLGATLVALGFACDDEHKRTPPGKVFAACEAKPGELPRPDCDNSSNSCVSTPGCTVDEARCGAKATCLPLADNSGKSVVDLRFRRLNIAAPSALATDFIQNTIVNNTLDLNESTCGELGRGLFSWILRVDRTNNTLITGGAPPAKDPLGQGFCFASFDLGPTKIQPLTTKIELTGSTFRTIERLKVNIPIFTADNLTTAIVLPISGVRVEGVTLSADGNCIGAFNPLALDPTCREADKTLCAKWRTAGALGGYITLEEADTVTIAELQNRTLCSFLVNASEQRCPRDGAGALTVKGDYCSKDDQPSSCQDSMWLAATFAASAAKIYDGAGIEPGCSGITTTTPSDAGVADSGPVDAADQ